MRPFSWSPLSLAVVSAGVGDPRPTRLLADRAAQAVCRSLAAGGARAEVEVLELHRLATDLTQHADHGRASLDLREAIAAVVAADGLVVAAPVVAASPSQLFTSFFAVLGNGILSGMPVLLAVNGGSPVRPPNVVQLMRRHLTSVHARPVPTIVLADAADWQSTAAEEAKELRACIDQAAAELAAAMHAHRQ